MAEVSAAPPERGRSLTDRIDAVLTHRIGGAIAFAIA